MADVPSPIERTGRSPPDEKREAGSEVVAHFEVRFRACLGQDGRPLGELPGFAGDRELMVSLYRTMTLTRVLDARAVSLQRTGQLGTYPSSLGQEAVAAGLASAMEPEDVLASTYREQAALIWRGVRPVEILQFWGGDERGHDWSGPAHDFPICIPIASHAPHAVGAALAIKLRGERRVVVCVVGDGATSKGDFYEAVNAAGVWRLPLVFVVNNNNWAISVPRRLQSAAETLAQKAIAGGLPAEQVDGNDAIAVRAAVAEAVERARAGGGGSAIEALTYRLADHTTADDASRYCPAEELSLRWKEEPIARLRGFLAAQGWWEKADEEALAAECREGVEAAVAAYLDLPPPPVTDMFDYLHETLPRPLAAQRAEAEAAAAAGKEASGDG